mmetsp:Transcript_17477/g.42662  ORF Transcript_17477/g.42662 Transcript_17477/m.42662 type:complete len:620 (+) Transcript_17477:137-1996(+)
MRSPSRALVSLALLLCVAPASGLHVSGVGHAGSRLSLRGGSSSMFTQCLGGCFGLDMSHYAEPSSGPQGSAQARAAKNARKAKLTAEAALALVEKCEAAVKSAAEEEAVFKLEAESKTKEALAASTRRDELRKSVEEAENKVKSHNFDPAELRSLLTSQSRLSALNYKAETLRKQAANASSMLANATARLRQREEEAAQARQKAQMGEQAASRAVRRLARAVTGVRAFAEMSKAAIAASSQDLEADTQDDLSEEDTRPPGQSARHKLLTALVAVLLLASHSAPWKLGATPISWVLALAKKVLTPVRHVLGPLAPVRPFVELILWLRYRHVAHQHAESQELVQLLAAGLRGLGDPSGAGAEAGAEVGSEQAELEWLNRLVRCVWKTSGHKFETAIKDQISGVLKDVCHNASLASLSVSKIVLGSRSPRLNNIRILPTNGASELQAEASLRWVASDGAGIFVRGKLMTPPLPISVSLTELDIEIPLWVRVRLNGEIPQIVTSFTVAATGKPKLGFDITIANSKISSIPGFRKAIDTALKTVLESLLVLPNKIHIQMQPDKHMVEEPTAVGKVFLKIAEAVDLVGADFSGLSDPYVEVKMVAGGKEQKMRTKIKTQTRFPVH